MFDFIKRKLGFHVHTWTKWQLSSATYMRYPKLGEWNYVLGMPVEETHQIQVRTCKECGFTETLELT